MRLERTPVRLADITALPRQAGLDLAVQRGGHQGLSSLMLRGVHNQTTIGREAGALVCGGVGDGSDGSGGKFHDMQLERPTITCTPSLSNCTCALTLNSGGIARSTRDNP